MRTAIVSTGPGTHRQIVRIGPHTLVATGTWEGRLTELGIKPFKALLGAIKLDDWVSLRVDARFARPAP